MVKVARMNDGMSYKALKSPSPQPNAFIEAQTNLQSHNLHAKLFI